MNRRNAPILALLALAACAGLPRVTTPAERADLGSMLATIETALCDAALDDQERILPDMSVGDAVVADELDVGRGDVLVAGSVPTLGRRVVADVAWMAERPIAAGERLHR